MADIRTVELFESFGIWLAGFILIGFVLVASILNQGYYERTSMVLKGSANLQPTINASTLQDTATGYQIQKLLHQDIYFEQGDDDTITNALQPAGEL